jgi:2-oxo-3-hexenedioate decarboxylase
MAMKKDDTLRWANYLDLGLLEARELDRITSTEPSLSLEEAYGIQEEGIRLREGRGEKVIGYKMGLTSKAKREQMGLNTSIYGVLTDRMQVTDGKFQMKGKIHPKIEPEIAFFIAHDLPLNAQGTVTPEQVLEACSGISVALEILDSRFIGFKYFSLPDVVADNSSSAYFVLGEPVRDFRAWDLSRLEMTMSVNDVPAQKALSGEISGNPIHSVIQLCELLGSRGQTLKAGSIVLAGAATIAVQLEAGQKISLQVDQLPGMSVSIIS